MTGIHISSLLSSPLQVEMNQIKTSRATVHYGMLKKKFGNVSDAWSHKAWADVTAGNHPRKNRCDLDKQVAHLLSFILEGFFFFAAAA